MSDLLLYDAAEVPRPLGEVYREGTCTHTLPKKRAESPML